MQRREAALSSRPSPVAARASSGPREVTTKIARSRDQSSRYSTKLEQARIGPLEILEHEQNRVRSASLSKNRRQPRELLPVGSLPVAEAEQRASRSSTNRRSSDRQMGLERVL